MVPRTDESEALRLGYSRIAFDLPGHTVHERLFFRLRISRYSGSRHRYGSGQRVGEVVVLTVRELEEFEFEVFASRGRMENRPRRVPRLEGREYSGVLLPHRAYLVQDEEMVADAHLLLYLEGEHLLVLHGFDSHVPYAPLLDGGKKEGDDFVGLHAFVYRLQDVHVVRPRVLGDRDDGGVVVGVVLAYRGVYERVEAHLVERHGFEFLLGVAYEVFRPERSSGKVDGVLLVLAFEEVVAEFLSYVFQVVDRELARPERLSLVVDRWYLYHFPFVSVLLLYLSCQVVFAPSLHYEDDRGVLVLASGIERRIVPVEDLGAYRVRFGVLAGSVGIVDYSHVKTLARDASAYAEYREFPSAFHVPVLHCRRVLGDPGREYVREALRHHPVADVS